MKNKKQMTRFLRSLKISCVILFCLLTLFIGIFITYEQMQIISFGEYKKAVEISEDHFRIMDFIIY